PPHLSSYISSTPPPTAPSTLSLHDALPILTRRVVTLAVAVLVALFLATRLPIGENPILLSVVPWLLAALGTAWFTSPIDEPERLDRKSTRLNSSHVSISYAVFCLKKKKKTK